MLFLVTRTSCHSVGTPPCPEAFRRSYETVDWSLWKSPEQYNATRSKSCPEWLAYGRDHRVTDDGISRLVPQEDWFVEIDTLDSLMAFIERHGELVISRAMHAGLDVYPPFIEIYDDSRE